MKTNRKAAASRAIVQQALQVHDWVAVSHPEWLQPRPKGFIPDLAAAAGLIWIEGALARPGLTHPRKAALEGLRKRGLDGSLTQKELNAFRRKGHAAGKGLNAFLAALRLLRRRGEGLAHLPPEVLGHLDAAIEILSNDRTLQMAGLRDEPPFRAISRKKIIT